MRTTTADPKLNSKIANKTITHRLLRDDERCHLKDVVRLIQSFHSIREKTRPPEGGSIEHGRGVEGSERVKGGGSTIGDGIRLQQ